MGGGHDAENAIWQDGGTIIETAEGELFGFLNKFKTQAFKTDDQFWFSFFHEAAHIILHGKKNISPKNPCKSAWISHYGKKPQDHP